MFMRESPGEGSSNRSCSSPCALLPGPPTPPRWTAGAAVPAPEPSPPAPTPPPPASAPATRLIRSKILYASTGPALSPASHVFAVASPRARAYQLHATAPTVLTDRTRSTVPLESRVLSPATRHSPVVFRTAELTRATPAAAAASGYFTPAAQVKTPALPATPATHRTLLPALRPATVAVDGSLVSGAQILRPLQVSMHQQQVQQQQQVYSQPQHARYAVPRVAAVRGDSQPAAAAPRDDAEFYHRHMSRPTPAAAVGRGTVRGGTRDGGGYAPVADNRPATLRTGTLRTVPARPVGAGGGGGGYFAPATYHPGGVTARAYAPQPQAAAAPQHEARGAEVRRSGYTAGSARMSSDAASGGGVIYYPSGAAIARNLASPAAAAGEARERARTARGPAPQAQRFGAPFWSQEPAPPPPAPAALGAALGSSPPGRALPPVMGSPPRQPWSVLATPRLVRPPASAAGDGEDAGGRRVPHAAGGTRTAGNVFNKLIESVKATFWVGGGGAGGAATHASGAQTARESVSVARWGKPSGGNTARAGVVAAGDSPTGAATSFVARPPASTVSKPSFVPSLKLPTDLVRRSGPGTPLSSQRLGRPAGPPAPLPCPEPSAVSPPASPASSAQDLSSASPSSASESLAEALPPAATPPPAGESSAPADASSTPAGASPPPVGAPVEFGRVRPPRLNLEALAGGGGGAGGDGGHPTSRPPGRVAEGDRAGSPEAESPPAAAAAAPGAGGAAAAAAQVAGGPRESPAARAEGAGSPTSPPPGAGGGTPAAVNFTPLATTPAAVPTAAPSAAPIRRSRPVRFSWIVARALIKLLLQPAESFRLNGVPWSFWQLKKVPTLGASPTSCRVQEMYKAVVPRWNGASASTQVFVKSVPIGVWRKQWESQNKWDGEYVTDGENFVMEAAALAFLEHYGRNLAPRLIAILELSANGFPKGGARAAAAGGLPPAAATAAGGVTHIVIVSELYGEDLLDYLERRDREKRPLSVEEKRALQMGCIQLLRRLHNVGLSHLDFTPENVLWNAATGLRLCDFAKSAPMRTNKMRHVPAIDDVGDGSLEAAGGAFPFESCEPTVGKGAYMPPECWNVYWRLEDRHIQYPLEELWALNRPADRAPYYFSVDAADVYMTGVLLFWLWSEGGIWKCSDARQDEKYGQLVKSNLNFDLFKECRPWPGELKSLLRSALRTDPRHRSSLASLARHPWFAGCPPDVSPPAAGPLNLKFTAETAPTQEAVVAQ